MSIVKSKGKRIYHYKSCGLDNVYLMNGFKEEETEYGWAISFENISGLHKAIALFIVRQDGKLSGKEFKFLRKELELTQEQLAKYLGLGVQEINRWENAKNNVNPAADRLLRLLYLECKLGNPHVLELLKQLQEMPDNEGAINLKITKERWERAIA